MEFGDLELAAEDLLVGPAEFALQTNGESEGAGGECRSFITVRGDWGGDNCLPARGVDCRRLRLDGVPGRAGFVGKDDEKSTAGIDGACYGETHQYRQCFFHRLYQRSRR